MTENFDSQENPQPLNWKDRLKHLQTDKAEVVSQETIDFAEVHRAKAEVAGVERPALPEGVSFNKSRGGGKKDSGKKATAAPSTAGNKSFSQPAKPKELDLVSIKSQFNGAEASFEKLLNTVSTERLVADYKKKQRLIWIGIGVVILGAIAAYSSLAFPSSGGQLGYWMRRIFLLPFPICLALAISQVSLKLAVTHPKIARSLMGFFSFGNASAKIEVAALDEDMGDYTKAEKTLLKAVKVIDRAKSPRDYITTYAYLSSVRANVGKVIDAERHVLQLLDTAKKYYETRPNDVNGVMLATVLMHAARVSDWLSKSDDSIRLYGSAIEILCKQKSPPADLLANVLASAGYQHNQANKFDESFALLEKADEINQQMPQARISTKAKILANLAIAYMAKGDNERAFALIREAEALAELTVALKERPGVYLALSVLHEVTGDDEAADHAYKDSIRALELQKPSDNLQLARVLKDYSRFLADCNRKKDSDAQLNRANQIKYLLDQVNFANEPVVKDQIKQVEVPTLKARFPVVWLLVAAFFTWEVVNAGLRIADNYAWIWSIGAITIVAMKLLAKYGKHADQETSQGAVLAVVSAIPMARHLVPELAVLPKRTTTIVLGSAVAILGIVNFTRPAPDIVPESGLFSYEYSALTRNLAENCNIAKAMKAAELARKPDISGNHSQTINKIEKYYFPKIKQPDEALAKFYIVNKGGSEKIRASEKGGKKAKRHDNAEKIVALRALIEKYPDFELPYASLAQALAFDDTPKRAKISKKPNETKEEIKETAIDLDDPQALIEKAYQINPDNNVVLMTYYNINLVGQKKKKEANGYLKKALKNMEDLDGSAAGVYSLLARGVEQVDELDEKIEKQNEALKQKRGKDKEVEAKSTTKDDKPR
jgi:tetratricopeptide (TPR) repeat protein